MPRYTLSLAAVLLVALCNMSNAQRTFRRVAQSQAPLPRLQAAPRPQLNYQPPAAAPTPASAPSATGVAPAGVQMPPCENCDTPGPNIPPSGKCDTVNPPKITPSNKPGCSTPKVCTPEQNPAVGKLLEIPGVNTHFYRNHVDFTGKVKVPHLVNNKKQNPEFGKQKYQLPCCDFEVCVVTECCVETHQTCQLAPYEAKLSAWIRTEGGGIDVYVLNVPGMPARWVYLLNVSKAKIEAEFGPVQGL